MPAGMKAVPAGRSGPAKVVPGAIGMGRYATHIAVLGHSIFVLLGKNQAASFVRCRPCTAAATKWLGVSSGFSRPTCPEL